MAFLKLFSNNQHSINPKRQEQLDELIEKLKQVLKQEKELHINFICTHNSRRSQLAELLLFIIAREKGMKNIYTYSGGTEATAFNHRMIKALSSLGITLYKMGPENNPLYTHAYEGESHYYFSKKYDHEINPASSFIPITVCSDADQNCPVIPNANFRFHLGYVDPKHSDDTSKEHEVYQNKVFEVGLEMKYLADGLKD